MTRMGMKHFMRRSLDYSLVSRGGHSISSELPTDTVITSDELVSQRSRPAPNTHQLSSTPVKHVEAGQKESETPAALALF
ncbi:hypothetical protein BgiBS90_008330 [Biomphalaria glabrata]|nr:hypothetical protein BgiBS90_008330 [Biomphalaria glabrata]